MERSVKTYSIRDAQPQDMTAVNGLFSSQSFPDAPSAEGVRIAETPEGELVGALFLEVAPDGSENVKTIVVVEEARGFGVGAALMGDALASHLDLRLVSRGASVGFYERIGLKRCGWEDIDPIYRRDCDECPDLPTCNPVPFKAR